MGLGPEFDGPTASLAAMNTFMSPAAAILAGMISRTIFYRLKTWSNPDILFRPYNLSFHLNCALAGLVSITAAAANVDNASAVIIGVIGAHVFHLAENLLLRLKIDDPLSAFAVHGACGIWGCLAVPLFDIGAPNGEFHGAIGYPIVPPQTTWYVLKAQIVGISAIIGFCILVNFPLFYGLGCLGLFLVDEETQLVGMDNTMMMLDIKRKLTNVRAVQQDLAAVLKHLEDSPEKTKFVAFLSHRKLTGGAMARWFQLELGLLLGARESLFIDSDNLNNLNNLLDTLRNGVESLIVLATPDYWTRTWCAAELTCALQVNIPVIIIEIEENATETALTCMSRFDENALLSLSQYGITAADVEQQYRKIPQCPIIEYSTVKQWVSRQALHRQLKKRVISKIPHGPGLLAKVREDRENRKIEAVKSGQQFTPNPALELELTDSGTQRSSVSPTASRTSESSKSSPRGAMGIFNQIVKSAKQVAGHAKKQEDEQQKDKPRREKFDTLKKIVRNMKGDKEKGRLSVRDGQMIDRGLDLALDLDTETRQDDASVQKVGILTDPGQREPIACSHVLQIMLSQMLSSTSVVPAKVVNLSRSTRTETFNALSLCRTVVLIFSKDTLNSSFIACCLAKLAQNGRRVIPIFTEGLGFHFPSAVFFDQLEKGTTWGKKNWRQMKKWVPNISAPEIYYAYDQLFRMIIAPFSVYGAYDALEAQTRIILVRCLGTGNDFTLQTMTDYKARISSVRLQEQEMSWHHCTGSFDENMESSRDEQKRGGNDASQYDILHSIEDDPYSWDGTSDSGSVFTNGDSFPSPSRQRTASGNASQSSKAKINMDRQTAPEGITIQLTDDKSDFTKIDVIGDMTPNSSIGQSSSTQSPRTPGTEKYASREDRIEVNKKVSMEFSASARQKQRIQDGNDFCRTSVNLWPGPDSSDNDSQSIPDSEKSAAALHRKRSTSFCTSEFIDRSAMMSPSSSLLVEISKTKIMRLNVIAAKNNEKSKCISTNRIAYLTLSSILKCQNDKIRSGVVSLEPLCLSIGVDAALYVFKLFHSQIYIIIFV